MITVTNLTALADRRILKAVRYGVYVMQSLRQPNLFLTGILGEDGHKTSALARLKQAERHGWKYVFFAQDSFPNHLEAAKAILHGRLCEEFRLIQKSQFEIGERDTMEKVQGIATEAIHHFMLLPQYSPTGVNEQPLGFYAWANIDPVMHIWHHRFIPPPLVSDTLC